MTTNNKIECLDHGYIKLIETWGSDERIIESARMSTNKGFLGWGEKCNHSLEFLNKKENTCSICKGVGFLPDDSGLLKYLYIHKHFTPFEMCGATFEIQAPIFVFREWHRHRTQSYNEMSARYIQMPDLHYVPSIERIMNSGQDTNNKQGSIKLSIPYKGEIYNLTPGEIVEEFVRIQRLIYESYEWLLSLGMSKELARINTPVSRYSKMRASANLRNWLHFLELRTDKNAQYEIRVYANELKNILSNFFPRTMSLFEEGISHGT